VEIVGLQFEEAGDYTLEGTGTAATAVSVTAPVTISILALNDAPITPIVINTSITFTPGSSFNLTANAGQGVIYTGNLMVNLSDAIFDADETGQATDVEWDLNNTLTASSEANSVALIAKKDVSGGVMVMPITEMVPEPASMGLLLVGLPILAARRRKA
jgi:hypothetical protein